jgi:hypothetical protein
MIDDAELAAIREWDSGTSDTKALLDVYRHRRTLLRRLDAMTAERDAVAADNAALRVEIAQWRAERDALAADSEARHQSCLVLMNSITQYRARVQALESALRKIAAWESCDSTCEFDGNPGECIRDFALDALKPTQSTERLASETGVAHE